MDGWLGPLLFGIAFTVFAVLLFFIRFRMEHKDDAKSPDTKHTGRAPR